MNSGTWFHGTGFSYLAGSRPQSVMCFQLHNGPLPLRRCSILRGEAGHCDAGGWILHGWDELRPAFESLFLWGPECLRVQTVTWQGQSLLDEVLCQIELLGHRIYHSEIGLMVCEELPEQTPILLCKLTAFIDVLSLLFFLHLLINISVFLQALL